MYSLEERMIELLLFMFDESALGCHGNYGLVLERMGLRKEFSF